MALRILDATTRTACNAATSQQGQAEALIAPWAGGNVRRRYYAGDTLLRTQTIAPWTINSSTPRGVVEADGYIADTPVQEGTQTRVVYSVPDGADIFEIDCTINGGGGSIDFPGGGNGGQIKTLCPPTAGGGVVFTALAGLPAEFVPSWRTSQTAQTWVEVPVSASLSALNPANDPELNPNYPSTKPEYMSSITTSWAAMFSAWNGGAWDETRQRWSNVRSGGHADNASNEQFGISLMHNAPTWTRTTLPSGYDGSVVTDDRPVVQAGSGGSTVVLAGGANAPAIYGGTDAASSTTGAYVGLTIDIASRPQKTITAYDGATFTATVDTPYTDVIEGRFYYVGASGSSTHGFEGEKTGRYSDGRMRSIHNYNRPVYASLDDSYIIPVVGLTSWTATRGNYGGVRIDRVTGAETFFAAPPSPLTGYAPSGSGSCYDPTRGTKGTVWWFGQNGARFGKLDVDTLTWSLAAAGSALGGYVSLTYLPAHDCILMLLDSGVLRVFDCAAETFHSPTLSGTAAGSVNDFGHAQPWYVSADNRVYWWNNPSGSTVAINYMAVPTNPKTDTWTIAQTTADGSNAVTPSARQGNGTYGRFFYSQFLDGFGLMNDVDGPVYFYARADL